MQKKWLLDEGRDCVVFNCAAFPCHAVRDCPARGQHLVIEPGSPWENGYCESLNSRLRDELLDREIFYTLPEANVSITNWRQGYKTIRPRGSLDYRPPAPETFRWLPPEAMPPGAGEVLLHENDTWTDSWGQQVTGPTGWERVHAPEQHGVHGRVDRDGDGDE